MALTAAVGVYGGHVWWLSVPMVDDAATSVAFALTWAQGHGLRLTPHSQVVEAFSNPLWVFLIGLGARVGVPALPFTQVLGQLLGGAALLLTAGWGPASERRAWQAADTAVALAGGVSSFAYWCASGMETGLEALGLGLSGQLLLRGKGRTAALALGALALTRPEAVLFAAAAGVFWLVRERELGKRELQMALLFSAVSGGYVLFRMAYFGSPLPNTYYAKLHWDFARGRYFTEFFGAYPMFCAASLAGVVSGLFVQTTRARALLTALWMTAQLYFVWHVKGDWMREWRFFAPLLPLAAQGIAVGLTALAAVTRRANASSLAAIAGVGLTCWLGTRPRGEALRQNPEFPVTFSEPAHARAQQALRTFGALRPTVALADIGGAGLVWRDAQVIDSAGLGDYALAHHAGNGPALEDYLLGQLPELLDAYGPSGHIRDFPRLMAHYLPAARVFPELRDWHGLFVLAGLSPTEDPRCAGGRARVEGLTRTELEAELQHLGPSRTEDALRLWQCAWAHRPETSLPDAAWRADQARSAAARGETASSAAQWKQAVAHLDWAAALDGGRARFRVAAERARARAFPK